MKGRNNHLSVSRVEAYARCPRRWAKTYLADVRPDDGSTASRLGSMLHEVLQETAEAAQLRGVLGQLDQGALTALYRRKFAAMVELVSPSAFADGLLMVRRWAADLCKPGREVLAIERRFTIRPATGPPIIGYIDRIDRTGPTSIDVIDYKSGRMLPSSWEVNDHLQLMVYAAAARRLYPWVETIRCGLAMLRHDVTIWAKPFGVERESAALHYLMTMGDRMEHDTELKARANAFCGWCAHAEGCPALEGAQDAPDDADGLGALLVRRVALDASERAAKAAKGRIDEQIKAHIEQASGTDTLVAEGISVRQATRRTYAMRLAKTAEVVAARTGDTVDEVIGAIAKVDSAKLKKYCKSRGDAGALALASAEAMATERRSGWLLYKALPWSEQ